MSSTWLLLALMWSSLGMAAAPSPDVTVSLDYGTFRGAYSSQYNVTYWGRIPFAAPPVGANRFRAPQPPLPVDGVYDSSQPFDMCPQRTVSRPSLRLPACFETP
jgi:carboxylesterase type B